MFFSKPPFPWDTGGDAETFKVLARAYRVLLNPKLREQYDILGIDLDDDAAHNDNGTPPPDENGHGTHDADASSSSTAQGIVQEIASMALTSIIQLVVRTGEFSRLDKDGARGGNEYVLVVNKTTNLRRGVCLFIFRHCLHHRYNNVQPCWVWLPCC